MNELEITFRTKIRVESDNRYRFLVRMMRVDRPRNWNFLCFNCGSMIVTVMNQEVLDATDFFDSTNLNNSGLGRHCKGVTPDGLPCPYTYFFNVQ